MPKRTLTEEEKYKADLRKSGQNEFKIMSPKEQDDMINYMWEREDAKRLKQFEETLGKKQGLKRKEVKEKEDRTERVGPGLWRDLNQQKVKKIVGGKHKLKWI